MSWAWDDAPLNTMRGSIVVSYASYPTVLPYRVPVADERMTARMESKASRSANTKDLHSSFGSEKPNASLALAKLPTRGAEHGSGSSARMPNLSSRQHEVLHLIVQGLSNKEIARKLDLAEGTVKIHVAALFGKLGVHRRAALAVAGAALLQLPFC